MQWLLIYIEVMIHDNILCKIFGVGFIRGVLANHVDRFQQVHFRTRLHVLQNASLIWQKKKNNIRIRRLNPTNIIISAFRYVLHKIRKHMISG